MRLALVADLHGNRPATEALERDLAARQVDAVWSLGDTVGKGPSNDYTCDWANAHCDVRLSGNWDLGLAKKAFSADRFYWEQLGDERLAGLAAQPMEHEFYLSGRRVRLFHGRPLTGDLLMPEDDARIIDQWFTDGRGGRYDIVIYADIHRQAVRTLSGGMLINTGSVGNGLGVNNCCYLILEGEPGERRAALEIRLIQHEYDREQAVRDVQDGIKAGLKFGDSFVREILTGRYSRGNLPTEE